MVRPYDFVCYLEPACIPIISPWGFGVSILYAIWYCQCMWGLRSFYVHGRVLVHGWQKNKNCNHVHTRRIWRLRSGTFVPRKTGSLALKACVTMRMKFYVWEIMFMPLTAQKYTYTLNGNGIEKHAHHNDVCNHRRKIA